MRLKKVVDESTFEFGSKSENINDISDAEMDAFAKQAALIGEEDDDDDDFGDEE